MPAKITGLSAVINDLEGLEKLKPNKVKKILERAMSETVEAEAKRLVLFDTGNLAKSIRTDVHEVNGKYAAVVGASAEYARHVEYGLGTPGAPYMSKTRNALKGKHRKKLKRAVFGPQIRSRQAPFLRPAFDSKVGEAVDLIRKDIMELLGLK